MAGCIRQVSISLSDEAGGVASQSTAVVVITPLGHDHERRERVSIGVHASPCRSPLSAVVWESTLPPPGPSRQVPTVGRHASVIPTR